MNIPFGNLTEEYLSLKPQIDKAIQDVIEQNAFVGNTSNHFIQKFESDFSTYLNLNNKQVITCGNGTDALEILLRAYNIGADDEVIVPAMSWFSTSEVVSIVGATPVFVDIEDHFYGIDPKKIEAAITPKTKAIIPVHLYGSPAQMDSIMEIAEKHNLIVIEDCAQAHGAMYKNKKIGTLGHAAAFSFYPGKNLGAYGDAGCMVVSNDTAEKARRIANHGQMTKHDHTLEGKNSRMDGIQAAILSVKLTHLESRNQKRQKVAETYSKLLDHIVHTPMVRDGSSHVFHIYAIQTEKRDFLQSTLKQAGIATGIHYPVALPFLKPYTHRGFRQDDFPIANKLANSELSLPMFPELSSKEITYIAECIKKTINE